jgi:hypothetical protein
MVSAIKSAGLDVRSFSGQDPSKPWWDVTWRKRGPLAQPGLSHPVNPESPSGPKTIFRPDSACPASGYGSKGGASRRNRRLMRDFHRLLFCLDSTSVKCVSGPCRSETDGSVTGGSWHSLLAHGCCRQAIVAAFDFYERPVLSWQAPPAKRCQRVHEQRLTME